MDASAAEELDGDERIHITLGDDGHLHSLQKGLREYSRPQNSPRFLRYPKISVMFLRKMVESAEELDVKTLKKQAQLLGSEHVMV